MMGHSLLRKILLIVEGEKGEPRLLGRLLELLNKSSGYAFVSFRTNIHELLRVIDEEYDGDYENVDLRSLLAARHPDDANLLNASYTDVVLVFDYEPQDAGRSGSGQFDPERLLRFATAFSNSTDSGKLFLNYPMLESWKDFKFVGDEEYLSSVVEVDDLVRRSYKASVNERKTRFDSPEQVGPLDMVGIIGMNVAKMQHILQGLSFEDSVLHERAPVLPDAYFECSLLGLLVYQNRQLADSGRVYIRNTCLFFALENWPSAVDQIWSKWSESCSS